MLAREGQALWYTVAMLLPGKAKEDFVDLGGATWLVQMKHFGAGSILVDRVEVLAPYE